MRAVLFVCTGNTCRSPMAEAIGRHALATGRIEGGSDVFVASAGVFATDGMPTSPDTVETLRDRGIEHDGRSKRLSADMVHKAVAVLCMTAGHREAVLGLLGPDPGAAADKVQMLDPAGDIADPIGAGRAAYEALADVLGDLVPRRLAEVLRGTEAEETAPAPGDAS